MSTRALLVAVATFHGASTATSYLCSALVDLCACFLELVELEVVHEGTPGLLIGEAVEYSSEGDSFGSCEKCG